MITLTLPLWSWCPLKEMVFVTLGSTLQSLRYPQSYGRSSFIGWIMAPVDLLSRNRLKYWVGRSSDVESSWVVYLHLLAFEKGLVCWCVWEMVNNMNRQKSLLYFYLVWIWNILSDWTAINILFFLIKMFIL